MNKRKRYVSASELGSVHYCARSFYFNKNNVPTTYINKHQRLRGEIAHEQLSAEVKVQQSKSGLLRRIILWILRLFK